MVDSKKIILVSEGLNEKLSTSPLTDYIQVDSKGIDGVGLVDAAMLTLATTTIVSIAKIVVELIRKDHSVMVKYDGKTFEIETENKDLEEVIKTLKSMTNIED